MLILCLFALHKTIQKSKENLTLHHKGKFLLVNLSDTISNLEGYISEKFFYHSKNLLGVRAHTPNFAVYGDLGRFPLSVIAKEISVKYWLKLLSNKNSLMFKIFQSQIEGFDAHVQPSRFRHERYLAECLLDELGYNHFWLKQDFEIPL